MENLDKLLLAFQSDNTDRCWVVSQLEEVPDERVVSLFVATLENFAEDDKVRIEILKSLVMRRDAPDSQARIAKAILKLLKDDDDDVIRQHAANALYLYPDVVGVLQCLVSVVSDESEDLDVCHNALYAIQRNQSLPSYREALLHLVRVPELGRFAERALDAD